MRANTAALLIASLGCGWGCGDAPMAPLPDPPPGEITRAPTTTSIEIDGPATVAPGATAQFTLTAYMSDGTSWDATLDAVWTTTHPFLKISSGLATSTGQSPAEASISARLGGLTRSRTLLVLREGTFRVIGRVIERGLGIPVPNARVEVSGGSTRLISGTALDGSYRLYGLAGLVTIVATKPGYRDDVRQVVVTELDQAIDFELAAGASIETVEGSYTLTMAASASCRDALPDEMRVRTYTATLSRTNVRDLLVTLSGAPFDFATNRFDGRQEPEGVVNFTLGDWYESFSGVTERFGRNRLALQGYVTARVSDDLIAGTLDGGFDLFTDSYVSIAKCWARDHSFELRRRS